MPKRKAADEDSPPWASWPLELPSCKETEGECKQFLELEDEEFHRELHKEIRAKVFAACGSSGAIVLAGGRAQEFELYDSDCTKCPFRQEAYFKYLFGINEPDCLGFLDLAKQESVLLVPFTPDAWERWNGERRSLEYYAKKYGVDVAYHTRDFHQVLKDRGLTHLFTLYGQNSDSDSWTDTSVLDTLTKDKEYTIDKDMLFPLLTEMRVFKTPKELTFMRRASLISSQAHVYVMRHAKPGMAEIQLEAMFKAWTGYFGGSRHVAYTCICGTGPNGSILHYGHAGRPNDRVLRNGDMALLDMGGEYSGYATDITRSFPVNGKFTTEQRQIYNVVYEARNAVIAAMKPGVMWSEMHQLSEKVILRELTKIGLLRGGTVEEMMEVHLASVFQPHGLGHFIGLNTHDVGGYPSYGKYPPRAATPGLCYLRTARMLQANMVITVEPGVYFSEPVLRKAMSNAAQMRFIDTAVLERYRGFGGVRLEDDIIVTETGAENLSVLPIRVEEIEAVMAR